MTNTSLHDAPGWPGHALIDIYPHIRNGCEEVILIGDPLHFPPDLIRRTTLAIRDFMRILVEPHWSFGPVPPSEPLDTSDLDFRLVQTSCESGFRQRILVSLIMRDGVTTVELAYSNVEPWLFDLDEIDWFVGRLSDFLNDWTQPDDPCFLGGQN